MCTSEGVVYDLENIAPFIKKFGIDPTSGKVSLYFASPAYNKSSTF